MIKRLWIIILILLSLTPIATAQSVESEDLSNAFRTHSQEQHPQSLSINELQQTSQTFDPYQRSFSQSMVEILGPMFIETSVTFPLQAMVYDKQAHGKGKKSHLLKGFFTTLIGEIPRTGLMMAYNQVMSSPDDTTMDNIMIGVGSGILSGVTAAPIELIVTQQRFNNAKASLVLDDFLKQRGVTGFRQGMLPTVFRQSLANIAFWGVQPILKGFFPEDYHENPGVIISSAAGSGFIGAAMAMPFDVVRGEVQRMKLKPGDSIPGTLSTLNKILQRDGTQGLWRGYFERASHYALAFSILRYAHEAIINYHTQSNIKDYEKRTGQKYMPEAESLASQIEKAGTLDSSSKPATIAPRNHIEPLFKVQSPTKITDKASFQPILTRESLIKVNSMIALNNSTSKSHTVAFMNNDQ